MPVIKLRIEHLFSTVIQLLVLHLTQNLSDPNGLNIFPIQPNKVRPVFRPSRSGMNVSPVSAGELIEILARICLQVHGT